MACLQLPDQSTIDNEGSVDIRFHSAQPSGNYRNENIMDLKCLCLHKTLACHVNQALQL